MGLAGHNLRRRMESEAVNKASEKEIRPNTQEKEENASTGLSEPQNETVEPTKKVAKPKKKK